MVRFFHYDIESLQFMYVSFMATLGFYLIKHTVYKMQISSKRKSLILLWRYLSHEQYLCLCMCVCCTCVEVPLFMNTCVEIRSCGVWRSGKI